MSRRHSNNHPDTHQNLFGGYESAPEIKSRRGGRRPLSEDLSRNMETLSIAITPPLTPPKSRKSTHHRSNIVFGDQFSVGWDTDVGGSAVGVITPKRPGKKVLSPPGSRGSIVFGGAPPEVHPPPRKTEPGIVPTHPISPHRPGRRQPDGVSPKLASSWTIAHNQQQQQQEPPLSPTKSRPSNDSTIFTVSSNSEPTTVAAAVAAEAAGETEVKPVTVKPRLASPGFRSSIVFSDHPLPSLQDSESDPGTSEFSQKVKRIWKKRRVPPPGGSGLNTLAELAGVVLVEEKVKAKLDPASLGMPAGKATGKHRYLN
ncbi:hypothetical protein HDU76_013469 [Blyttiomyces sp. JEL0837]|nr:hypothetical protein HDU76_013469 [Blyttiomyces sp. JEL0837]